VYVLIGVVQFISKPCDLQPHERHSYGLFFYLNRQHTTLVLSVNCICSVVDGELVETWLELWR